MYTRLFVIAGITWILEIIGFLVAPDSWIFYVSDVWNCLQGVFIFIILIMRRRVLRMIKERYSLSFKSLFCVFSSQNDIFLKLTNIIFFKCRWNNMCHKTNPNEDIDTNSNSSTNYFQLNSMTSPK